MKSLKEVQLKPNERAAIEEAASGLRAKLPVSQVILFGSKARGDSDEESDIDLLLLTTRKLTEEEEETVRSILWPIQDKYEIFFGTIKLPAEDWYHGIYQVWPIRTEVDRDGVAV